MGWQSRSESNGDEGQRKSDPDLDDMDDFSGVEEASTIAAAVRSGMAGHVRSLLAEMKQLRERHGNDYVAGLLGQGSSPASLLQYGQFHSGSSPPRPPTATSASATSPLGTLWRSLHG